MTISTLETSRFAAIADRKRKSISWVENFDEVPVPDTRIHLDMDMVDASIDTVIERLSDDRHLRERFQHFQKTATNAQKIDFVYGSGTFWFPDEMEALAHASRETDDVVSLAISCRVVVYIVCRCIIGKNPDVPDDAIEQLCSEISRKVCSKGKD